MKFKTPLFLSTALNVLLIVTLVITGIYLQNSLKAKTGSASDKAVSSICTENERLCFLVSLKVKYEEGNRSSDLKYWESDEVDPDREYYNIQDNIRNELIRRYGQKAVNDPIFEEYFFPLNPGFEFLDHKKQVVIDRLMPELRDNKKNLDVTDFQAEEEVRQLMSKSEFDEFAIRISSISKYLRNIGLDWTQEEFRHVYFSIRDGERDGGQGIARLPSFVEKNHEYIVDSRKLYRQRINFLDKHKMLQFLKIQDPAYKRIVKVGTIRNLTENLIDEAYTAYVDIETQIIDAQEENNQALVSTLLKERDQIYSNILGAPDKKGMMRSALPLQAQ